MSSLPFPHIWTPHRDWFCPRCGKPRLLRRSTSRAKSLLRRLLDPLAVFANGDLMLDASGNVILDASGNLLLDDGSGNSCCCVTPGCVCSGTTHYNNTLKVTFSAGLNVAAGCYPFFASSTGEVAVDNPNLTGAYCMSLTSGCNYAGSVSLPLLREFTCNAGGTAGCPGTAAPCSLQCTSCGTPFVRTYYNGINLTASASAGTVSLTGHWYGTDCFGNPTTTGSLSGLNFSFSGALSCGGSVTFTLNNSVMNYGTVCNGPLSTMSLTGTVTVADVAC